MGKTENQTQKRQQRKEHRAFSQSRFRLWEAARNAMDFSSILSAIQDAKCVGFRYQRAGHGRYRDRVTVYRDGRILFERFCYGEAAGLVFRLWAESADASGAPQWDFSRCNVSNAREEAPRQLTGAGQGGLVFDGKPVCWECVGRLRSDKANGYGGPLNALKRLWKKKIRRLS